ncbi:MAG TPA: helix-turn-helix domain-containing protein [Phycisphaerae bacterium]|nr:helix-turn-helix domain-containing protein [Phycisphaerae bacterium]HNU44236.1 helix-turn-helix domain-containing protein [Phycisphaerae bacterium]
MPSKKHSVTPDAPAPLAVGAREAARMLGIGVRLLWSRTNSGEIPHLRLGARTLYNVHALQAWLDARTKGGAR